MRWLSILAVVLLTACSGPNDKGPGGVTQGEADALNAAAAKLDTPADNGTTQK